MRANKCGGISIGPGPNRPLTLSHNSASIRLLDITKDHSMAIDNTFKPFKTPNTVFFLTKRSFVTLTPDIFSPLYSTLVLLCLGNAIQASSPYIKKDDNHLLRLQHLATEMVYGCRGLSYEERLEKLDLYSLVRRKLRGDLSLAYKPTVPWIYPSRNSSLGHPVPT